MNSIFEAMGGTYTLGKDGIYYPNIVSTDEAPHYGKYGMLRKTYLKEYRKPLYTTYVLEDCLVAHLNAINEEANEKVDVLIRQMAESQNVTEELKRQDQMAWIGIMNQIKNMAEEIVWDELICR